ncbi:phosphoglycerate mutase family protein-like protein [Dendryphion nanum]|uniref:Phosphoglycerate mutase family protein-like protein n=1 Tax=Dendryphion nanum TaxID=256645 RepID=A0A9P9IX56_9PLEO|nr:phosphoglycerate mutase family protein-like protein [Dendryphion nanum]
MAPKQIHLIRHAQGFHNLCIENHNIRDPLLTPEGKHECLHLSNTFKNIQAVNCIIASPIRRALYTALIAFNAVLKANPTLKIIALPELQETSALPCDIGLSCEELTQEFKHQPIDFTHVGNDWNNKVSSPFAPRTDLLTRRARKARRFLQQRTEDQIAVVTHGGLLHFVTDDWLGSMAGCGTGWTNCELRTYGFDNASPDAISNASLVETQESILRRTDILRSITPDQQVELRNVTQKAWAQDGYIILTEGNAVLEEEGVEDEDAGFQARVPSVGITSPVDEALGVMVPRQILYNISSDEIIPTSIRSVL